jgi:hypothetical protein
MISYTLENNKHITIDGVPNECPYCHKSVHPIRIGDNESNQAVEILFRCPNLDCLKVFIGYYFQNYGTNYIFHHCNIGILIENAFSEEVKIISPTFVKIYNEAYFAEQYLLIEICGVGYRKALEFLIKDYLIKNNPTIKEDIKKKPLGICIKEYVSDAKVKKVSERAVWLGNDETHYLRIWESQSLVDLKKLIDLTLHWIEMEELTNSFETKMPATKKEIQKKN